MSCWLICQNKLVISLFPKTQQICIYVSLFLCCIVSVCACHCIRAPWNLNHTSAVCLLRVDRLWCCLESRRQNPCCSPLSGDNWRRQSIPQKYSQFALSKIRPFHYELWFDPFSCCLCCSFIQFKPPQPQQGSKAGHTLQQGSHEAVKHDQIKARLPILGIKREFLYYFNGVSAEIRMVVFILCSVNLSPCFESFGRAQWPQIFRRIVSPPCLLCVNCPFVTVWRSSFRTLLWSVLLLWTCSASLRQTATDFCSSWSRCCRKFMLLSQTFILLLLQIICLNMYLANNSPLTRDTSTSNLFSLWRLKTLSVRCVA